MILYHALKLWSKKLAYVTNMSYRWYIFNFPTNQLNIRSQLTTISSGSEILLCLQKTELEILSKPYSPFLIAVYLAQFLLLIKIHSIRKRTQFFYPVTVSNTRSCTFVKSFLLHFPGHVWSGYWRICLSW